MPRPAPGPSPIDGWARSLAKTDAIGKHIVIAGSGAPHVVYVAHMDEIAYMVTSIRADDLLQVEKHGGFYDSQYEGLLVQVETAKGPIHGVAIIRSTHLWRGLTGLVELLEAMARDTSRVR